MDLAEIIRTRRSIASFTHQPVPVTLVRELLETAVYAPNHRLTEPWRFVILTGGARDRYAEIRRDMVLEGMTNTDEAARQLAAGGTYHKFAQVPLYLLVVMGQNPNPEVDQEDYAACCCVIENFLLLAWERGLGTSWKTFKRDPRLRELAELLDGERVVGIIHVGYPTDEDRSGQRKPIAESITVLS